MWRRERGYSVVTGRGDPAIYYRADQFRWRWRRCVALVWDDHSTTICAPCQELWGRLFCYLQDYPFRETC